MWPDDQHREGTQDVPSSVLVVDDDPLNVEMLTVYLEQEGYRVASAFSGAEALESVAAV
jgi:CheY-like chemotaxis protein